MAEFVYIQNYAKRGNLAISTSVFDEIISIAINKKKWYNQKNDTWGFIGRKVFYAHFSKNYKYL